MSTDLTKTKIKSIRTYQAVQFDGKPETFFTSKNIANRIGVSIKILNSVFIEVSSPRDRVLIPITNISGVYTYETVKDSEDDAKRGDNKQTVKSNPKRLK